MTASNSGGSAARSRVDRRARAPRPVAEPDEHQREPGAKWCSSGTNGAGGAFSAADQRRCTSAAAAARPRGGAQRVAAPVRSQNRNAELDDRADLVQPELELGDDAEVAAAAAQRPEQVGVLARPRPARTRPSASDDLGRLEVVDLSPCLPGQPAHAAAEREAADAGVADQPGGHGEPVLLGGGVEVGRASRRRRRGRAGRSGSTTTWSIGLRSIIRPPSGTAAPQ